MAYCRFSCDNFRSDVYVYEGDDVDNFFITVRIASSKYVFDNDAPDVPALNSNNAAEVYVALQKLSAYLRDRPRIRIIKEHAGKMYHFADIPGAIIFLRQLQQLGYHVPEHAFERLNQDYEEDKKERGST
jgi:hypothetical protein